MENKKITETVDLAELEAAPETVAKQAEPNTKEWLEEYVPIYLFKDNKDYKSDVFVSVNGENCKIKRGVQTKIKRKFWLVIEESMKQKLSAEEAEDRLSREVLLF